jgi:hypothetical protein
VSARAVCYRSKDVAQIAALSRSLGPLRGELDLESFLPLSDAAFLVLLALGAPTGSEPDILETMEESARARGIAPGILMNALDRLVRLGLLSESDADGNDRYRLTKLGDAVLFAESGRRRRRFDPPPMPRLMVMPGSKRLALG